MSNSQLIDLIKSRGITSPAIIEAFTKTPREQFVPEHLLDEAYADYPLPIGHDQTISQPSLVAAMTEQVMQGPSLESVLEIGTGSGYQAAILSHIFTNVHSIERIQSLYENAQQKLNDLGRCPPIHCHCSDGYLGWPNGAPYDAIIVTAAALETPKALLEQLKEHGKLIIPVGTNIDEQQIRIYTRDGDQYPYKEWLMVRFVPMLSDTDQS